ncbi:MAG: Serine protease, subfamily, contains C-terminal domain [Acidobacteriales bacterium]|nr:Serine protease, subfamily, contains C-terminal domain [Terriglobales bacterium]
MTDQADLLTQFSNDLAARAEAVVAVRLALERHNTGMVWRSWIVVVSEHSLPRK